MSTAEVLFIVGGLVIGWFIVSVLIDNKRGLQVDVGHGEWTEILGVAADASLPDIEVAYRRKCEELEKQQLRILTRSEKENVARYQTKLDEAYREGKSRF
jgi:preprotein translocase subunit Sec63